MCPLGKGVSVPWLVTAVEHGGEGLWKQVCVSQRSRYVRPVCILRWGLMCAIE